LWWEKALIFATYTYATYRVEKIMSSAHAHVSQMRQPIK